MAKVYRSHRLTLPGYRRGPRNETMADEAVRMAAKAEHNGDKWFEHGGELYVKCDGQWTMWHQADPKLIALELTGSARPQRIAERGRVDRQSGGGTRGQMSVKRGRGRNTSPPAQSGVSQGEPRAGTP